MKAPAEHDTLAETMAKADDIYARIIRPQFEAGNTGRLVAIDVDSAQFEIGDQIVSITDRLRERCPEARIGVIRIGVGPVYRLGLRGRPQ
jgi:hypothetical protein